jgi:hypothetical protein
MRTKLLTILLLGFACQVSAQELGVRAGIDLYKLRRNNGQMWTVSEKYTASPSFGMSFRMPFKMRSAFRTGLYYSSLDNVTQEGKYGLSQKTLRIPIQYGFTVIDEEVKSGFFFGPNLCYGLSGEYSADSIPINIYKDPSIPYKRLFFGIGAGFRVEYMGISLEFQYNAEILRPSGGYGSSPDLLLGNELISVTLGYSYSFAKKQHRYARRR